MAAYAASGSLSSRARESNSGRIAANGGNEGLAHQVSSIGSRVQGRNPGRNSQGRAGALTRDLSLASLDKLSVPGPGQYETNVSSCVSTEATRKLQNDRQLKRAADRVKGSTPGLSLGALGSSVNQESSASLPGLAFGSSAARGQASGTQVQQSAARRLAHLSIPSIPSRFLTPVLRFDLQEKEVAGQSAIKGGTAVPRQELITESILVAKVARLTHDGRTVGPGDYDVERAHHANSPSPRGSVRFAADKSKRLESVALNRGARLVGPGSYEISKTPTRAVIEMRRPTIPQARPAGLWNTGQKRKRRKNGGSIRADWEEEDSASEEEGGLPGPGEYLQDHHTSTFGSEPILHDHPQRFGAVAKRFKDHVDKHKSNLGPGQYLSQHLLPKFVPKKGKAESQAFLGPERKEVFGDGQRGDQPGPQDYLPDQSGNPSGKNKKGTRHPFQVNSKRFSDHDNGVPGAGQYAVPSSVAVKNPSMATAAYKSGLERELDLVIGRSNPGVGEYDS